MASRAIDPSARNGLLFRNRLVIPALGMRSRKYVVQTLDAQTRKRKYLASRRRFFVRSCNSCRVVALTTVACSAMAAEPPARRGWRQGAPLPLPLDCAMAGANRRHIIIAGGAKKSFITNASEIYDPVAKTYTAGAGCRRRRVAGRVPSSTTCSTFSATRMLPGATDPVWAYDPVANRWASKAPMPNPRSSKGAARERQHCLCRWRQRQLRCRMRQAASPAPRHKNKI